MENEIKFVIVEIIKVLISICLGLRYPNWAILCTEYRYDLIVIGILKAQQK